MIYLELIVGGVIGIGAGVAVLAALFWFVDRRDRRETLARFDREMERQKRLWPLPWEREDRDA